MVKYIFWDLDGTITKSERGIMSSVKYALDKYGISLPESQLLKFIGPSLFESFSKRAHLEGEDVEKAIELYREVYTRTGLFDAEVYDGIPKTMEELKSAGYRHIVVTSKPKSIAERVLKHF